MEYGMHVQNMLPIGKRKWILVMGLVALTHLLCQSLLIPYSNALLSLFPDGEIVKRDSLGFSPVHSSGKSVMVEIASDVKVSNLLNSSLLVRDVKTDGSEMVGNDRGGKKRIMERDAEADDFTEDEKVLDNDFDFVEDATIDNNDPFDDIVEGGKVLLIQNDEILEDVSTPPKSFNSSERIALEQVVQQTSEISNAAILDNYTSMTTENMKSEGSNISSLAAASLHVNSSISLVVVKDLVPNPSIPSTSSLNILSIKERPVKLINESLHGESISKEAVSRPVRKKMRCEMPPKTITTISEMERLLIRHRSRSRAMIPRWTSERDQEILAAKLQIQNAPPLRNDHELFGPVFQNVSTFKRSYELMERILKVYVYKEGEKPIFHQPVLKGLYASEGWFMKLMEGNRRYVVKDPRRAHLFYMPFSSRMLEQSLYVRNSHNRTNLRQFLKAYSEKIAGKYRFWNRTGGADHFLVACHDWAPYETRHHMEQCVKALCNADVTLGFKIGRDVSLPETYVRSARNPLRDLGGKPPSQRHILAFYAGNMHGYLRPILLKHWKDRDPAMKILGPMPPGVASKMNYIQHMKSSKYCICPKGYEVNSPRVVEAIFYECVPVIISDNFVPPFFGVLNWDAFSVILSEKDIPNLKDILSSIPEKKYLEMQLGVRRIQRHFLWHAKPVKYDLFHMTLHSIWYNRVFQVKLR